MSSFTAPEGFLQPIDWGLVEKTIFDWVNSQVQVEGVIWQNQDVPQPQYPYVDLLRANEVAEGGVPETRNNSLDAGGSVVPPGDTVTPVTELDQAAYQPTTFTLTARAFTDEAHGANDPNQNAMKILSRLKASLGLRSVIDAFFANGVSIVEPLALIDTSELTNGDWQSRGTLDIALRTASVMTERVGYIDKTQLKSTELGVDFVVDAS